MPVQPKTTVRQELFLRELMKVPNQTEAWCRIYRTSSRAAAQANSSRTLKKPHVQRRYNELLERQMKRSDITVDKVLADYQYALNLAKDQGRAAEIVGAAQAQAKLVGLLRDRIETGAVGDFTDINDINAILETVAREAGDDAAMTLAALFGVNAPETPTEDHKEKALLIGSEPPSDAVN